jgi:hypothetical protein
LCAAFYFDVLHFSSTLFGADWEPVWVLLAWIEFGVIARWAGGFPVRGPLGPLALVGGAILGDIGASVLLAPRAATPLQKARVALTASAGAMLSPIGTPVTLLLVDPAAFGLLPIALAAISWPRGWAQDQVDDTLLPLTQTGANRNLLILVVVVLASFAGFSLFWVLGIGCVALMLPLLKKGIRPPTPWGKEAWIVVLAILCFARESSAKRGLFRPGFNDMGGAWGRHSGGWNRSVDCGGGLSRGTLDLGRPVVFGIDLGNHPSLKCPTLTV